MPRRCARSRIIDLHRLRELRRPDQASVQRVERLFAYAVAVLCLQRLGGRPSWRQPVAHRRQLARGPLPSSLRVLSISEIRARWSGRRASRSELGREVRAHVEGFRSGVRNAQGPAAEAGLSLGGVRRSGRCRDAPRCRPHVDEVLVHDARGLRVSKELALHHVAPVAPRIADRQEDRSVPAPSAPSGNPRPGYQSTGLCACWSRQDSWTSPGGSWGARRSSSQSATDRANRPVSRT